MTADEKKLELLQHFVEDDWDLRISDEDAILIVAEMPFLDIYEREDDVDIFARILRKPTIEEAGLYYKDEADYFRKKYWKLVSVIEKEIEV